MSTMVTTASGSRYVFASDGLIYRYSDYDVLGLWDRDSKTEVFVEAMNGPKIDQGMVLATKDGLTVYTSPVVSIHDTDI